MLREGKWVRLTEGGWYRQVKLQTAIVVSNANDTNVRIYVPEDGKERWASRRYLESYEEVLPEVKVAAKKVFVDMALMTKDREWFEEVTT